jgi:hypothetical protein
MFNSSNTRGEEPSQLTAAVMSSKTSSSTAPTAAAAVTPIQANYDSLSAYVSHFRHRDVSPSTRRVVDALLSSVRDLPTVYDAVRVRFIEVYEKLVTCPPQ